MVRTKSAAKKPRRAGNSRLKRLRTEMDAFAGSSHNIQWGDHLCYKAGGKLFAILGRDPDAGATSMSIKCQPKNFGGLTRRKGVTQAPYLARRRWIRIADIEAIAWTDLRAWVRESYDLVVAGLTRSAREGLGVK